MSVHIKPSLLGAALAAAMLLIVVEHSMAGGEWPEGPYKEWFQNLQRPDNDQHPERRFDPKSLSCCGAADVVKTRFKVESGGGRYPEDRWYAWNKGEWMLIPPEKIAKEFAPNGEAYLFMWAGTIQCFVRPKGGL